MPNFKEMIDVILVCMRWYATYLLHYRHLKEMMEERGVSVDRSSINRRTIHILLHVKKMTPKTMTRSLGADESLRP